MARHHATLVRILSGRSDAGIRFAHLCQLLGHLGFVERVRGSHHKFSRDDIPEILVLQPAGHGHAKDYQVKQVRRILNKYRIGEAANG